MTINKNDGLGGPASPLDNSGISGQSVKSQRISSGPGASGSGDNVSLAGHQRLLDVALGGSSASDTARVSELKQAVSSGAYQVNSAKLATALVNAGISRD